MMPSGRREVSGCRSHRQQDEGRRGWQYRHILPLLGVSCAPVGGNETWMTHHLACRPIARQGACVSAHHFSGPRALSIFPPWDAHERAGEAVVGWQNRLMSGCVARDVHCQGAPHFLGADHRAQRWAASSSSRPWESTSESPALPSIGFKSREFKDEHLHKTPISGVLVRELRAKRNGSLPPG